MTGKPRWRVGFEARVLAACKAPEGSTFDDITGFSESWAYSSYTAGEDSGFEVSWHTPDDQYKTLRWDSMAELFAAMGDD